MKIHAALQAALIAVSALSASAETICATPVIRVGCLHVNSPPYLGNTIYTVDGSVRGSATCDAGDLGGLVSASATAGPTGASARFYSGVQHIGTDRPIANTSCMYRDTLVLPFNGTARFTIRYKLDGWNDDDGSYGGVNTQFAFDGKSPVDLGYCLITDPRVFKCDLTTTIDVPFKAAVPIRFQVAAGADFHPYAASASLQTSVTFEVAVRPDDDEFLLSFFN